MADTSSATPGFDPYRAWLNVRDVRRPLNAYQLLELAPLEDDAEVIRQAAGRKRAALEAHRREAPAMIWQQISGELEEAIRVLLDPDRKLFYDQVLEQARNNHHDPAPSHDPFSQPGAVTDRTNGAMLKCRGCGTPNPATRRFCAQCGRNLWEPCFNCGTLCHSGENFCGACGANLSTSAHDQVQRADASLAEVERLYTDSRYDEAIALLTELAKAEHPRLAGHVIRARQMLKELVGQRDHAADEAEAALQQARQQHEEQQFSAAVRTIEGVPKALRNEEMQSLLDEARARCKEIATLDEQLREAIRTRQTSTLLPKVERLLVLQPSHKQAQQLAERFRQRVSAAVQQRLAKHQYEDALKLIHQLPAPLRSESMEELNQQVSELAWLSRDLRQAAVVDKTLVAVAGRLRKHDPRLKKVCEELERRSQLGTSDPRRVFPPWAAAPQTTPFGCPVEWMTMWKKVQVDQTLDKSLLAAYPGVFHVACGLALQGLDKVPLKINLRPAPEGMLGRMSQIMPKRTSRGAWGLDLSASGLKAVKMAIDRDGRLEVKGFDLIEHNKPLTQTVDHAEEYSLVEETLRKFLFQNKIDGQRVCVGLPARMVLTRQLKLPVMNSSRLLDAVRYEAQQQLDYCRLEDLIWDYQVLNPDSGGGEATGDNQILVLGAKRQQVAEFLEPFEKVGIRVDLLQADGAALHNLISYEYFDLHDDMEADDEGNGGKSGTGRALSGSSKSQRPVAVLDIGCDSTNLVVSAPDWVWFRTLGIGGQSFTRSLVKEFGLTFQQAEDYKLDPPSAPSLSKFFQAVEPIFEDLVHELERSFVAMGRANGRIKVSKILGGGGGLLLHGLLRHLRTGQRLL